MSILFVIDIDGTVIDNLHVDWSRPDFCSLGSAFPYVVPLLDGVHVTDKILFLSARMRADLAETTKLLADNGIHHGDGIILRKWDTEEPRYFKARELLRLLAENPESTVVFVDDDWTNVASAKNLDHPRLYVYSASELATVQSLYDLIS